MSMKQYKIYRNDEGEIEAVKRGWSWPAFFFTWMWALFKRLWLVAGVTLAAFIPVALLFSDFAALANLASLFIFGLYGNAWREKNLAGRGFQHVGDISAAKPAAAIELFLARRKNNIA